MTQDLNKEISVLRNELEHKNELANELENLK